MATEYNTAPFLVGPLFPFFFVHRLKLRLLSRSSSSSLFCSFFCATSLFGTLPLRNGSRHRSKLNNNHLSPLPETPSSEIDAHLPQPESPHLPEIDLNLSLHDDELQNETNHTAHFDLNNSVNHRIMASNEQRQKIFEALLKKSANGFFLKGESTTNEVAKMFGVSSRTVQRIWRQGKGSLSNGSVDVNVNHRKTSNCGRKRIEINIADLQRVELSKRTTIRSLASAVGICYA